MLVSHSWLIRKRGMIKFTNSKINVIYRMKRVHFTCFCNLLAHLILTLYSFLNKEPTILVIASTPHSIVLSKIFTLKCPYLTAHMWNMPIPQKLVPWILKVKDLWNFPEMLIDSLSERPGVYYFCSVHLHSKLA